MVFKEGRHSERGEVTWSATKSGRKGRDHNLFEKGRSHKEGTSTGEYNQNNRKVKRSIDRWLF